MEESRTPSLIASLGETRLEHDLRGYASDSRNALYSEGLEVAATSRVLSGRRVATRKDVA